MSKTPFRSSITPITSRASAEKAQQEQLTQRLQTVKHLKPGDREIHGGDEWVRQEDIHDVVERDTGPDRETKRQTHITEAHDRFVRMFDKDPPLQDELFEAGFDAGEQYGHTIGFARGATEAIHGLTVSKGRGKRRVLATGNELAEPSTKMDAINEEQLTAEVCALLSDYAIVPTDFKVRAVLDALNTLPGIHIKVER